MTGDYQIEIRVRNGRILALMRRAGHFSVASLCRAMGTPNQYSVAQIIDMKTSPLNRSGEWRPYVLKMAEALNCLPDDLFTEAQRTSVMESNRAVIAVSEAEVGSFLERARAAAMTPEHVAALHERKGLIHEAIATLTPRERSIVIDRFGLFGAEERTLEEVGATHGVTKDRIRQIEAKALRKLKHPKVSGGLRDLARLDEDGL